MRALRRVLALVLVLSLFAGAGVVAWNRWWRRAGPENPGMECPTTVKASGDVPLAAIGVDRVALIGDSIMDEASCSIADSLSDVGIETSRHAVSGSGLLTGPLDWQERIRLILQLERPDVVVAIFVGNYFSPPARDEHGTVIEMGTDAFFAAWQDQARFLSAQVRAANAELYWVRPPPITEPVLKYAARLYEGYRKIEGDHFLSSGRVLAGPDNRFVMTKESCGERRTIRTADRIHLTDDGARIYGQQIAHDLTADLGILTAPRPC